MTEYKYIAPDTPIWDDEYLDRVGDRLAFNYDLQKDHTVQGERFALYGRLPIERHKQFFHPSINWANHYTEEYRFARRVKTVTVNDLERVVDLGYTLADEWIETDETHYGTDFTFVLVAPEITDTDREYVTGVRDRTLIKLGFRGHYERPSLLSLQRNRTS
jgi:hypothetical protein